MLFLSSPSIEKGHCVRVLSLKPHKLWVYVLLASYQAPLSVGFPRQERWSGLPFPSPGDLPDPGIEPEAPASPALAGTHYVT